MRAILQAVIQRSEQPLARLPAGRWRERTIAAFREMPMHPRGEAHCAVEVNSRALAAARFTAGRLVGFWPESPLRSFLAIVQQPLTPL
jgi:hypothetical protein